VPISVRRGGSMCSTECRCSRWLMVKFLVLKWSVRLAVTAQVERRPTHDMYVIF